MENIAELYVPAPPYGKLELPLPGITCLPSMLVVCLCSTTTASAEPPVEPTPTVGYAEPAATLLAPMINYLLNQVYYYYHHKRTKPVGIAFEAPDHATIIP